MHQIVTRKGTKNSKIHILKILQCQTFLIWWSSLAQQNTYEKNIFLLFFKEISKLQMLKKLIFPIFREVCICVYLKTSTNVYFSLFHLFTHKDNCIKYRISLIFPYNSNVPTHYTDLYSIHTPATPIPTNISMVFYVWWHIYASRGRIVLY